MSEPQDSGPPNPSPGDTNLQPASMPRAPEGLSGSGPAPSESDPSSAPRLPEEEANRGAGQEPSLEGASAAFVPADAPAPPARGRHPLKTLALASLVALALLALVVALLPTILSQGILSALLRPQLGAKVGASEVSWTGGLRLEALDREHKAPNEGDLGYAFWCRELALETSLVDLALAGASGGEVDATLVLRGAGLRVELRDPELPPTPQPEGQASSDDAASQAQACSLRLKLVLDGLDLHLRQAGGPLLILEGLKGQGALEVGRDGACRLSAPLELSLDSLRVPLGDPLDPWGGRLDLRGAVLTIQTLVLPVAGDPQIAAELTSPSLHAYGLEIRDARLTAKSEGAQVALALTGRHPGAAGSLAFASKVDRTNATRWPVSLDLDLRELPVRGIMADLVPCLLPMVHSVNNRGGRFPPLSLHSRGEFELVFDEEGLDAQATLDTLQAKGKIGLAPGKLGASLLLRGYASALTKLEVGGVLGGFLPPSWEFQGGESPLEIRGERLELHSFPLETKHLDLRLGAEVGLVSGDYDATVRGQGKDTLPEAARSILATLERVGGIRLRGNLYEFDAPAAVLPARQALVEAIRAEGAAGVWLERGGPLLDGARDALGLPR